MAIKVKGASVLPQLMPVKLFFDKYHRQSKQARNILRDAKVDFDIVDLQDMTYGWLILESLTGEVHTPVLFVDGVAYRGLEGVRDYLGR